MNFKGLAYRSDANTCCTLGQLVVYYLDWAGWDFQPLWAFKSDEGV